MGRNLTIAMALSLLASCTQPDQGDPSQSSELSRAEKSLVKVYDGAPEDCNKLVPTQQTFAANPAGLATGWADRDAQVAFVVDESFVDLWGEQWPSVAHELIVEMSGFYSREINLSIDPVQLEVLPGFDVRDYPLIPLLESADALAQASLVMEDFIAAYQRDFDHTARDSVQAFFGADVAGGVAGKANCIGGAGHPDVAFVWGEAHNRELETSLGPIGWFRDVAAKIAIHEFGHMMGAHHHYANCAESAGGFAVDDIFGTCTMMYNDVGLLQFHFSSANRLATRTWAEQVDL